MNGAIAESIFNVFFKLNFSRPTTRILATPLGIREIAVGEMLWSLFRGTLYVDRVRAGDARHGPGPLTVSSW